MRIGGTTQSLAATVPTADIKSTWREDRSEVERTPVEESYVKTEAPDFESEETATVMNEVAGAGAESSASSSQLPIAGRSNAEAKGNKKPNNRITFEEKCDEANSAAMDEGA